MEYLDDGHALGEDLRRGGEEREAVEVQHLEGGTVRQPKRQCANPCFVRWGVSILGEDGF